MIAAAALVGFALLATALGPRALGSDGATTDSGRSPLSPRWTIVGWQALSLSVVGALVMALLALAAPLLAPAGPSATTLAPTWAAVQHHYANPGGALVAWLCLGIAALVLARLTLTLTRVLWRARRRRAAHLDALALVGTEQAGGFHLLDSAAPAVFCLPGRRPRVVVTTGARELLDDRELALVLAHERAHLGARHDLVLAGSAALARAIPLGLFTLAHSRIAAAAEMHADDAARTRSDREVMARALLRLTIAGAEATTASTTGSPDPSLTSGCAAAERVRRLTGRSCARRAHHAVLPALATAGILALPVGLALAPAVGATTVGCCDASELGSIPRR